MVCTDKNRLQQILMNLISNAIKFTEGGEIVVTVRYVSSVDQLTFKEDESHANAMMNASHGALEVQVEDNGIGINKENQKNLFKLFGFLNETEEINTKGIGLGLYICRRIIKQLGGDIICRSEPDVGTTFAFLFLLGE